MNEILKSVGKQRCVACGHYPNVNYPNDPHHVKTKKTGGKDAEFNLLPLCRTDHVMWHFSGPSKFFKKYPKVWNYLQLMGWEMENGKLFHIANTLSSHKI